MDVRVDLTYRYFLCALFMTRCFMRDLLALDYISVGFSRRLKLYIHVRKQACL